MNMTAPALCALTLAALTFIPAAAQEKTGVTGSPNAT